MFTEDLSSIARHFLHFLALYAGFRLGLKVWRGRGLRTPQNVWPLPYLLTTHPITC